MMRTATVFLAVWVLGACNAETVPGDGTGGKSGAGGSSTALCGGQVCTKDQVCCGPAECGRCIPAMSGQACPASCPGTGGAGGAGTLCGGNLCPTGQVCCGPAECGRCVPEGSDIGCPATCGSGGAGGSGAVCVPRQGSCAQGEKCCSGLTCCAGMPVPQGQEYCSNVCPVSDRNLKTQIEPVDQDQVLDRLMSLPVSTWSYRSEGTGVRHLGPMAQDFQAAFGLGASDRTILQVDGDGVSLAAIQSLARRVERLSADNTRLRQRLEQLESQATECRPWPSAH